MAESINRFTLGGNVVQDVEIRTTKGDKAVANIRVAVNEGYRKPDGTWENKAEFFNVVLWEGLAEKASKRVQKGSYVYIEGPLQTRSYEDKDGNTRYFTEVKALTLKVLGNGKESEGETESPVSAKVEDTPVRGKGRKKVTSDFDDNDGMPF